MGNKIREIRERKGISQEDLARKANVSRATISKLENDEESEVKVGTLKAIAEALGVTVSKLLNA